MKHHSAKSPELVEFIAGRHGGKRGKLRRRRTKWQSAGASWTQLQCAAEGEAMIEFISLHIGDAAMFIGFLVCVGIAAASSEANDQPQLEPKNSYDL
jgi:hypothetical protein